MEPILNNFIKALGWSIFHSLWQCAIVYAILYLTMSSLPKMKASWRYNIAFISVVSMFVLFCSTFISIFQLPVSNQEMNIGVKLLESSNLKNSLSQENLINLHAEAWFPLIAVLYCLGIVFQFCLILFGYWRIQKLKSSCLEMVPNRWHELFIQVAGGLNIKKKISFYLSPKVNVPIVIGFFKPVILFPLAFANGLDEAHVEAILIHELSHIRRNDYLLNFVKTAIETLLFFNPFIWLAGKYISLEREHACDDQVIASTGTPLTYAHALLQLELLQSKESPSLALALSGQKQHLYQRIKRITNMKTNYMTVKQQVSILLLAISTMVSLAWISPVKPKKEKDLLSIKKSALEAPHISEIKPADTDTTKKIKKYSHKITITDEKGKTRTYSSVEELPDSLKNWVIRKQLFADSISKFYNSKEWKDNMAKVQERALEMRTKFESKEWKDNMAKIQEDAIAIQKKFESKEWKDNMAKIQEQALAMQKKFESKEWKDNMAKIQEDAIAMQKKFESKEWKDNMAKIQDQALAIQKKFESKEWKDNMAKIQDNAIAMQKKFESKEWKDNMAKIQEEALKMQQKFNSTEWKEKIKEMEKLYETPEFIELKKKFDREVLELKKKKGL